MRSANWWRQARAGMLFAAPGILLFATFTVYPLAKAFQISLYDWKVMPGQVSPFVGAANYLRAFNDPVFWVAMRNTLAYTAVTVPGQMILAMAVALLLESIHRGRILFRTLYYLPVITSWVVVSVLFRFLFASPGGIINYMFTHVIPLLSHDVAWLLSPSTAMVPIVALGIWKGVGWSMVIFLAALQGIPPDLYEAASIDGAGRWQRLRSITLPLLRPTILFDLVMLTIGGFNVFISVYLITGGGPLKQTEVVLSYMYHQAFEFLEFGYGSAIAFLLAIVIISISFVQFKYLRQPTEVEA